LPQRAYGDHQGHVISTRSSRQFCHLIPLLLKAVSNPKKRQRPASRRFPQAFFSLASTTAEPLSECSVLDVIEAQVKSVRESREAIPTVPRNATSKSWPGLSRHQSNPFDEQSQKPEKAIGLLLRTCRYAHSEHCF